MIEAMMDGQVAAQNQGVWLMKSAPAAFAADWDAAFSATTGEDGTKLHEEIFLGPLERQSVGLAVGAGWGNPPSTIFVDAAGRVLRNLAMSVATSAGVAKWGGSARSSW